MREHDQPRRHARSSRVVGPHSGGLRSRWRGLGEPRTRRVPARTRSADPIDLAARRVLVWEATGERWVVLSGEAAVLQGAEGLRARGAVVRIIEVPMEGGRAIQADIYAEGEVRISGQETAPGPRCARRSGPEGQFRLSPYRSLRPDAAEEPPRGLMIVDAVGFRPARTGCRAAATRVPPAGDRCRAPGHPPRPSSGSACLSPSPAAPPRGGSRGSAGPAAKPSQRPGPRRRAGSPGPSRSRGSARAGGPTGRPRWTCRRSTAGAGRRGAEPDQPGRRARVAALAGRSPTTSPRRPCGPTSRAASPAPAAPPSAPIMPGSQRVTSIFPRSGRKVDIQFLTEQPDGTRVVIYRGGVNIVTKTPQFGIVDIEAESAVIWRHPDPKKGEKSRGPNGELIENANQPMEVYLEGNVILRQDENKVAGKGDQRTFRGEAGLLRLPDRPVRGPRRRGRRLRAGLHRADEDQVAPDRAVPQADSAARRHARPGREPRDPGRADDDDRQPVPQPGLPDQQPLDRPDAQEPVADRPQFGQGGRRPRTTPTPPWSWSGGTTRARTSSGWAGFRSSTGRGSPATPTTSSRPLRQIAFRTNNYFGQQVLTDWNGFKVFGLRRPKLDRPLERRRRLPERADQGLSGARQRDGLVRQRPDPRPDRSLSSRDQTPGRERHPRLLRLLRHLGPQGRGIDVLGSGPAIVTNGPPGAGKRGFQRSDVPPFQEIRGRFNIRHMQRFLARRRRAPVRGPAAPARGRPTSPTATSSKNTTSGCSTRAWTRRRSRYMQSAEEQPVVEPLDRGQPPELVHRHPVASPARLLSPGRFAL